MKIKLLFILSICLLFSVNCFAADQWERLEFDDDQLFATAPGVMRANNAATERLVQNYRRGMKLSYSSATTISVGAGEVTCSNADGSNREFRATSTATNVTFSDIDTGPEANSVYYVYATCDTDIEGVVFKVSVNPTTPTGATTYRRLGQFYNDASLNIENGSVSNDDNYYGNAVQTGISKSIGTTYYAYSDGVVVSGAENTAYCDGFSIYGMYVGTTSSPTTKYGTFTTGCAGDKDAGSGAASMPVKRGNYYKVVKDTCYMGGSCNISSSFMYFVPLN